MPLDFTNPNVLKFVSESYERTEKKSAIWFLKNHDKLVKLATFPENYKGFHALELGKQNIEHCMPALALGHSYSMVNRRRKALRDGVVQGVSTLQRPRSKRRQEPETAEVSELPSEPMMKPLAADVESILYKPYPFGGRRQYLNKRNKVTPEEKYNFCETSTNVYGWRLNDSKLSRQPTKYGRCFVYKRDLTSRTGPQPDPAFYKTLAQEPYSKCFS